MAQQTAVEWLIEQLQAPCRGIPSHVIERAKQMEKEQMKIEIPSDEEIYWNDEKPSHIDNYIVHKGAEGVSLGWWNGEEWIEMWGSNKLNVYGWIKIPNTPVKWMREQIQQGNK